MKDKSRLKACESLISSMLEALRVLDCLTRQRLANHDYDLSPKQVFTLFTVSKKEGLTMTELADEVMRDKTTITRMIDGLEKLNLVARVPDKKDHRRMLIYQTAEGKRRVKEIISWRPTVSEIAAGTISTDELLRAQKVVSRFAQNLSGKRY